MPVPVRACARCVLLPLVVCVWVWVTPGVGVGVGVGGQGGYGVGDDTARVCPAIEEGGSGTNCQAPPMLVDSSEATSSQTRRWAWCGFECPNAILDRGGPSFRKRGGWFGLEGPPLKSVVKE